ncbi:AEC family transporter [Rubrobacter calidifluminis]|uniref:AEC family transporter n=1 Tax=Rubrobacter calidifluminis TaxID=1392640 RepID=UPI00235DFA68|nr:AEC family transporter [Rubrobacter calidifluminis]
MITGVFMQVLLPILVVVGAGYALRRLVSLDIQSVNRVSIYLMSPALIFSSLARMRTGSSQAFKIVIFMVVLVVVLGAVSWLAEKATRKDRATTTAVMLCTMFMNAGNYGLPLARFAFGERGFEQAVVFFVVQSVLAQTLAVYIAGSGGGGWREGLRRLVRMPQIYAVAGGLALREVGVPTAGAAADLMRGVNLLAEATIPLLLVILGMQLAETRVVTEGTQVALAAGMRLVLSVPLAFAIAHLLGMGPLTTRLAVVLGSMPTAVNITILSIEFDVRPKLVSSVVVVSTAASFITLTLLLVFMGV